MLPGGRPFFQDRRHAGRRLATALEEYRGRPDLLVLGLPRGGIPVAYEVARELGAPLDVFLVRKLGVPGQEELAMGAIASGGAPVLNQALIAQADIPDRVIERVVARERDELERRDRLYRGGRPHTQAAGRTVILVDDGLATGATMRAAALALRRQSPAQIIVAVPVAAESSCAELEDAADRVVCLETPEPFLAVGCWYEDFDQTSDEEVRRLLRP